MGAHFVRGGLGHLSPDERLARLTALSSAVRRGDLSLGDAVRFLRATYLGMSRARFAQLVGVSLTALAQIETDSGNPRLGTLERVLRPFGLRMTMHRPDEANHPPQSDDEYHRLRAELSAAVNANRRRS
jgi:transcriptional regulator with XRE-family HTH domain